MRFESPALVLCLISLPEALPAQSTGTIRGTVTLQVNGELLHDAHVLLIPGGRATITGGDGRFEFRGVLPGRYELVARAAALSDERKAVEVKAGETAEVSFALSLRVLRQEVTVTASGAETAVEDSFQTVTSRDSSELLTRAQGTSLGDLLEAETGIAKRSFGPGSTRPIVRGFDGDRVLMLQDGVRSGTLSYQSGDHGEPVDAQTVERVEVVRGPATLLYGSNAIGGVVNVISNEHILHEKPHDGFASKLNGVLGSNNAQAQGSGSVTYGHKNWLGTGSGGGNRTGDYKTPLGRVINSGTSMENGTAGFGRFGERTSFNLGFQGASGVYGIPFEDHGEEEKAEGHQHEKARLDWSRYNLRLNGALKKMGGFVQEVQYYGNYSSWKHAEKLLEEVVTESGQPAASEVVGTRFFNKTWSAQGTAKQRKAGPLTGSFGFWGLSRGYEARGDEALSPPVSQNAFAGFVLEELEFERVRFQAGVRVESNRYKPASEYEERSFTGVSASGAAIVPLWSGASVYGNYIHSYRAPALEELYNRGPHPGNNAFEIGDPHLLSERSDGVEAGFRYRSHHVRIETSLFRNQMRDFVYLHATGEAQDGLPVGEYRQADARFLGAEARMEFALHPSFWLLAGFDAVDANLTESRENLPRIPPVRGRFGFDWRRGAWSLRPEVMLANRQWQVSGFETPTAGYAAFGLTGGYVITSGHFLHMFSVNVFNVSDRLYRNHVSFVKEFAPEIGVGARFGYTFQGF